MKTGASKEAQMRLPGKEAGAHADNGGQRSQGMHEVAEKAASCAEGWLESMARKSRERKKLQRRALLKEEGGSAHEGRAAEVTLGEFFKKGLGVSEADGTDSQVSQRQPQLPEKESSQVESEEEILAQRRQ